MKYAFFLGLIFCCSAAFCQDDKLIFGDTEKTSHDPDYHSKGKNKERKTLTLIKKKSKKVPLPRPENDFATKGIY